MDITQSLLKEFREKAFAYWPTAKRIPINASTLSIFDRTKSFLKNPVFPTNKKRQEEFLLVLNKEISRLLGDEIAKSVTDQLQKNQSFSTAQHFSSIIHPRNLNATLQSALPFFEADPNNEACQNIIVLSCANISFDNPWFPRGIIFHTLTDEIFTANRLVFFSRKVRPLPITYFPAYEESAIIEMQEKIQDMKNKQLLPESTFKKLQETLDVIFKDLKVLACKTFTDQITITSFAIWKKILEAVSDNLHIPNLVFLEQENIVLQLLLTYHIGKPTIINEILFNPKYHALIEEYFDGIQGGFSIKNKSGTFLFWAIPKEQKYRTQLFRNENMLESLDGSYKIELTPESIIRGIKEKELIPSTQLSMILLSLYYGYALTGGMEQANYLTLTKEAYIKLLEKIGDQENIDACNDTITTNNVITRPVLTFLENNIGNRDGASGLDLLLYGKKGSWNKVLEASKKVTLGTLIDRTLPNIYDEHCPDEEKEEKFTTITEAQIEKLINFPQQIPTMASI